MIAFASAACIIPQSSLVVYVTAPASLEPIICVTFDVTHVPVSVCCKQREPSSWQRIFLQIYIGRPARGCFARLASPRRVFFLRDRAQGTPGCHSSEALLFRGAIEKQSRGQRAGPPRFQIEIFPDPGEISQRFQLNEVIPFWSVCTEGWINGNERQGCCQADPLNKYQRKMETVFLRRTTSKYRRVVSYSNFFFFLLFFSFFFFWRRRTKIYRWRNLPWSVQSSALFPSLDERALPQRKRRTRQKGVAKGGRSSAKLLQGFTLIWSTVNREIVKTVRDEDGLKPGTWGSYEVPGTRLASHPLAEHSPPRDSIPVFLSFLHPVVFSIL